MLGDVISSRQLTNIDINRHRWRPLEISLYQALLLSDGAVSLFWQSCLVLWNVKYIKGILNYEQVRNKDFITAILGKLSATSCLSQEKGLSLRRTVSAEKYLKNFRPPRRAI